MQVGVLLQFLRSLVVPLQGADFPEGRVKKLEEICQALEPFQEYDVADFAAFLRQAEEYRRTGIIPLAARRKRAANARPKPPPVTDEDVRRIAQEIMQLAEKAMDREVNREALEADLNHLNLPQYTLTILGKIAGEIGVSAGPRMRKEEIVNAIRQKVLGRKEATERTPT
jgi:hypothetical protein